MNETYKWNPIPQEYLARSANQIPEGYFFTVIVILSTALCLMIFALADARHPQWKWPGSKNVEINVQPQKGDNNDRS